MYQAACYAQKISWNALELTQCLEANIVWPEHQSHVKRRLESYCQSCRQLPHCDSILDWNILKTSHFTAVLFTVIHFTEVLNPPKTRYSLCLGKPDLQPLFTPEKHAVRECCLTIYMVYGPFFFSFKENLLLWLKMFCNSMKTYISFLLLFPSTTFSSYHTVVLRQLFFFLAS